MIFIVCGVSGSGKTTVGKELASRIHAAFIDADDFHPAENVQKMKSGQALSDQDRLPWLQTLHEIILTHHRSKASHIVLACSALTQNYRDILSQGFKKQELLWIYTRGTYERIYARMQARKDHFMSEKMLQSQFDILEEPQGCMVVDVEMSVVQCVEHIFNSLENDQLI